MLCILNVLHNIHHILFRLGLFAAATVGGPNVAATRAGVSAKFSEFATVSASGRGSIHSSDIRSVNKSVFYPFLVKTLSCLRNQRNSSSLWQLNLLQNYLFVSSSLCIRMDWNETGFVYI